MRTIRVRLAVWYAVALAVTMFAFAAVIYVTQRRDAYVALDRHARAESDLIASNLAEAFRGRGGLVVVDPQTGQPTLTPEVSQQLESVPGFVVIVDNQGDVLHLSADARALPYGSLIKLLGRAFQAGPVAGFGLVDLGAPDGEIRYYVRRITNAGPRVDAVLTGSRTSGLTLGPRRLLVVMVAVAPLILAASTLIGFLVVRTLMPVHRIAEEVAAISDGRSLHRRLAPLRTDDELARLTATLNAMFERLERSFASLRRFTADASHELKTPLTVMRAGLERAITHPDMPPEAMGVLDETLAEVRRMTEIVDSLLMLSRVDEGRAPLHLEDVDLGELLEELAETGSLLGEQAGVTVRVVTPRRPMRISADGGRLRQLLMNLLTNAIKYTPQGGSVDVGCRRTDVSVVITVQDTGIGIAPGDLPHIFDRFWRADPARSRTGERAGVGLGLAICKWIAEAHGGSIDVESRPGRGTTFTVTIPADLEVS